MTQTLLAALHAAYRASLDLYLSDAIEASITKGRFPHIAHKLVDDNLVTLLCDKQDALRDTILLTKAENVTDALLQLTYVFSEIRLTTERLPMSKDAERRLELIMRALSSAAITIAEAQGLPAAEVGDPYDWERMRTRVPPPPPLPKPLTVSKVKAA